MEYIMFSDTDKDQSITALLLDAERNHFMLSTQKELNDADVTDEQLKTATERVTKLQKMIKDTNKK